MDRTISAISLLRLDFRFCCIIFSLERESHVLIALIFLYCCLIIDLFFSRCFFFRLCFTRESEFRLLRCSFCSIVTAKEVPGVS